MDSQLAPLRTHGSCAEHIGDGYSGCQFVHWQMGWCWPTWAPTKSDARQGTTSLPARVTWPRWDRSLHNLQFAQKNEGLEVQMREKPNIYMLAWWAGFEKFTLQTHSLSKCPYWSQHPKSSPVDSPVPYPIKVWWLSLRLSVWLNRFIQTHL